MQRNRLHLIRVAMLSVAFSAVVGCAAETVPSSDPQVDPLNPQPLPPLTDDRGENAEKGSVTTSPPGSSGDNGSSGTGASSGSSSSSSGTSGTNPNVPDAGGQ